MPAVWRMCAAGLAVALATAHATAQGLAARAAPRIPEKCYVSGLIGTFSR